MGEFIDLHTHSNCSDGELSPGQLLERAAAHDVGVLSITDHDTVAAYVPETLEKADELGIELVHGIEISTAEGNNKMHVLGLFVDVDSPAITEVITMQAQSRADYARDSVDNLRAHGWYVADLPTNTTITTAHIANAVVASPQNAARLIETFGAIPNRGQFIEGQMNKGRPCYVGKHNILTERAIEAVHSAGGIAVLAHPVALMQEGMDLAALESALTRYDFDGLEALYYYYNKSADDKFVDEVDFYSKLAGWYGLLVSGGSDFHGVSSRIGNFVDVGFVGQSQRPDRRLLDALSLRAQERKYPTT